MPLSVSPGRTVCVLARAGPAAKPAMTMPAPAAVIILVCTFMKLLVQILITAAQRTQGAPEDANSAGAGFTWVNAESPCGYWDSGGSKKSLGRGNSGYRVEPPLTRAS